MADEGHPSCDMALTDGGSFTRITAKTLRGIPPVLNANMFSVAKVEPNAQALLRACPLLVRKKKYLKTRSIPRRSPIQILTPPDRA